MKAIALVVLAGCMSTRQLAEPADPRLRTPDQHAGFVVRTTERWRERVDPNTILRFKNALGGWTDALMASDLHVDHDGVWVDRRTPLVQLIDAVHIDDIAMEATQIAATQLEGDVFERDGAGWKLSANSPHELVDWLDRLELAIARLEPSDPKLCPPDGRGKIGQGTTGQWGLDCSPLTGGASVDDVKLYTLRVTHGGEPLGMWTMHSPERGWLPAISGTELVDALHVGREARVGWHWDDVAGVEATSLSGAKTLAAIVGYAALAPIGLLCRQCNFNNDDAAPAGDWSPAIGTASNADARPLFSLGSRIRAIAQPTITLDGAISTRGDLMSSGMIAHVRLAQVFELGGGVREEATRDAMGWSRSTTAVFQMGLHLPLDAGLRIAIPLGFEAGRGGEIASDLRFPWGVRYTSASGRWFATLTPATPAYLHVRDEPGRWSLMTGTELGATF